MRQHACLVTSQTCPHSPSSFVRTARIPPSPTGRTQSSSLALPAATTAAGRAPRYLPALTATAAGGHPTRENDTREGAAVFSSIWSGLANDLRPRHGRPDGVPLAGVAAVRSVCCGVGGPTGDFFFWLLAGGFPSSSSGRFSAGLAARTNFRKWSLGAVPDDIEREQLGACGYRVPAAVETLWPVF